MATPTTLPAAFVSGDTLLASQMNALRGAFRVLQVQIGTTSTTNSNSTTSLLDSDLSVSITPQSSSSTILVYVAQNGVWKSGANAGNGVTLALLRGATVLTYFATGVGYTGTALELNSAASAMWLDTPATTSATTYKTQIANRVAAATVSAQYSTGIGTPTSYIVAMEISA